MVSVPSVRRMVMFKHGVAYLERSGPAEGSFELSFERSEMNDVLKSLAVWVAAGDATVGAIAFEKPEDPEDVLARRKLLLPEGAAIAGLFRSLRGRRIAVGEGASRVEGEVIGVDETRDSEGRGGRSLVLRASATTLSLIDVALVRDVELLEAPSRADLDLLVDRSRAAMAGESRSVSVALTGKADDLRVSYVVPAPVWRVSYRIAREASGAVLMGWGIVHNPADEDLDDIELTLTTGQPVSFQIDLYHPKLVERAIVEETSRAGAAPTSYERAAPPPPPMAAMRAPAPASMAAPMPMPGGFGPPPQASMTDSFGSASGASDYADRGEHFEYRLASPISIKRGGSAMVPLFVAKVDAKKERIWRVGSGPNPDLVMTFDNDSGAVLEEGPAVVYDESVYAGEAMVPYSARGAAVKLAFAKDLAVRCRSTSTVQVVMSGIRLGTDAVIHQGFRELHHELLAESDHAEAVEVIFELGKQAGRSLDPAAAQPFEETASFMRFRAQVEPFGRASLRVVERWPEVRRVEYRTLDASVLDDWLSKRFLDRATRDALGGVRAAWEQERKLSEQRQQYEAALKETYVKQGKISEQLAVLKEGGQEGALRLRYVKELGEAQDRVTAYEAEIQRLNAEAAKARALAAERLSQLVSG